jgi:hypothetical protein
VKIKGVTPFSLQKGMSPIASATDPAAWTVIDFKALRPLVSAGKFGPLNPNLLNHIYGFDAALVIGARRQGPIFRSGDCGHTPL